ncbi:LysM peptidoglycan-binding domain-containing protein [Pseudidiomarina halophila]|nr:LysM domain-containing protein [Pseudidiomarina halophila]
MATWRFQAIAVIGLLLLPSAAASAPQENGTAATSTTSGDVIRLREDAPREYVVKKGDTLWDISELYLNDPWHWPELWRLNDDISNPHLIYPGDRLYLSWVNGRPQLSRKEFRAMSPEGVIEPKGNPIPTFDREALTPFIDEHHIVSAAELATMPRILGDNRGAPRLNGIAPVYIDGNVELDEKYRIFTPVDQLGDFSLLRDVAGVRITFHHGETIEGDVIKPKREIRRGDVVIPHQPTPIPEVIKATSGAPVDGYIVATLNDQNKSGKYDILVIDKGSNNGVEIGQMYQALRPGIKVFTEDRVPEAVNPYKPSDDLSRLWRETVTLPPHATSELLVIKVYPDYSVVIVVDANEWLEVGAYYVPKQLASD